LIFASLKGPILCFKILVDRRPFEEYNEIVDFIILKPHLQEVHMWKKLSFFSVGLIFLLSCPSLCFAQSDSVIATIPARGNPTALVYNSTDNKIYCANKGIDSVTIIDGEGDSTIATVGVGNTPYALAYNPTNNKIYCANQYSDNVTIIDGGSNAVIGTPLVGDAPMALVYNPTNNQIYCANEGSDYVSVIDGNNGLAQPPVELLYFAWEYFFQTALGYNPTDNKIYCATSHWNFGTRVAGAVQIINPATDSVVASVLVNHHARALAYNSTNNKIYCASYYGVVNEVTIIDGAGDSAIATVEVGDVPGALAYNDTNNKIYCANRVSDNVTIIDGEGDSVIATVEVGDFPLALVYNPQNNKIYCTNQESDTVAIIDGAGDSVIATVGVGDSPAALAHNSTDNKIYCANYNDASVSVIACSPPSAVDEDRETQIIPDFSLRQNYPNPFNPRTIVRYSISWARSRHTTLAIYNILGQKVRTLVDRPQARGNYEVIWDAKDDEGREVAGGIYFCQLKAGGFTQAKKMIILK